MNLHELDICGCLGLTNRVLYAFQESLLHMREAEHKKFVITLGGIYICVYVLGICPNLDQPLMNMHLFKYSTSCMCVSGTEITGEVAMQFASDTGATMSLHDLTTQSLLANYDPFYAIRESCVRTHKIHALTCTHMHTCSPTQRRVLGR